MFFEFLWNKMRIQSFYATEPLFIAVGTGIHQIMDDKTLKKSKASGGQQVVREAVSSKLKAYYDDISRQEVPKRFLDLLADLDKAGEKSE